MNGIYHNLGCTQTTKHTNTQAQKIVNMEISPNLLDKNGKTVIKVEWLVQYLHIQTSK